MGDRLTDLEVFLHHETSKAFLVSDDGDKDNAVWVPKSQCECEANGKTHTLTIPEWLAKDKGLI